MRDVITERDIPLSGELKFKPGAIITMSARDLATARGVALVELADGETREPIGPANRIALGSDHGGFHLKEALKPLFDELNLTVTDIGVHDTNPADYPDIAEEVAKLVATGAVARGVIIDGAGIGSCMAANKVPGVRASLCYDKASAQNSREHNDSNVLTLGSRLLTQTQAEEISRVWVATPFAGGRHAARVQKISRIEQRYANWTPPN